MKRMVALAVLLVVGIVALWPRGRAPVEVAPTVAAPARNGSIHARIIHSAAAREIAVRQPKAISGPPGKPAMMEGATKDEVLGAWGAPVKIRGQVDMPATSPYGVLPAVRTLEAWFYGGGVVVYWASNGELSASPFSPQDGQMLGEAMHEIAEQKQRAFWDELLETYGTNKNAPAFLSGAPD